MRVLVFITQFYQRGGAEKLGVELAEGLNARGIHADILSQYTPDLPGVHEAEANLLQRGVPAVRYLGMAVNPPLTSVLPAVSRLRRLVREGSYDIVETSSAMPTLLAAWAVRGTRARVVSGLHQVYRRDRENTKKHKVWRASVRLNPRIRYYAISEYVAQAWVDYAGVSPDSVSVVYNGIPDSAFDAVSDRARVRADLGLPEDAKVALFVGRLAAYKGIDTIQQALGPVAERLGIHIVYVGWPDLNIEGTSRMLAEMKGDAGRSTWCDRVHYVGRRDDVSQIMASADVLVHPARMEGFGLVLAEALAARLPVVASDVEAIPEILAGTHSVMVPSDDPGRLRDAVVSVLARSKADAASAADAGRRRAEAFRESRRLDALITLFGRVAGGSS